MALEWNDDRQMACFLKHILSFGSRILSSCDLIQATEVEAAQTRLVQVCSEVQHVAFKLESRIFHPH